MAPAQQTQHSQTRSKHTLYPILLGPSRQAKVGQICNLRDPSPPLGSTAAKKHHSFNAPLCIMHVHGMVHNSTAGNSTAVTMPAALLYTCGGAPLPGEQERTCGNPWRYTTALLPPKEHWHSANKLNTHQHLLQASAPPATTRQLSMLPTAQHNAPYTRAQHGCELRRDKICAVT